MLRGQVTAVELHPGRARELEENVRRLGATNVRVVNADVRRARRIGASTGRSSTPHARASACSPGGPTCAGAQRPSPAFSSSCSRAAAERTRLGGTILYSVCTLNADENEAVVDASGLEPEPLGEEWPPSRIRSVPSSC